MKKTFEGRPIPFKPLLSLSGISKRFGALAALCDVDLEVYPGQVVAVVGENGAGKSTLVKILAGVHRPDAGMIRLDGAGIDPADPAAALRLGISTVFQELALCDNLDVVANLFLGQELSPLRLDEVYMEARCRELLQELSVDVPDVHLPVASLSRGQCQSVSIARCLLRDPKLVVLDEPTASLGVAETAEVLDLIERIRDRGTGVLVVSRNVGDVESVADIVVVLRMGRSVGVRPVGAVTDEMVGAVVGAGARGAFAAEPR